MVSPAKSPLDPRRHGIGALVVAALLTTGCVGSVRVKSVAPADEQHADAQRPIGAEHLSESTLQTLRLMDLDQRIADNPASIIAILNGLQRLTDRRPLLAAQAELSLEIGQRYVDTAPETAAEWHLLAASRAYQFLFDPRVRLGEAAFDGRFQLMREVYDEAVGDYLAFLKDSGQGFLDHERDTLLESFQVEVLTGPRSLDPATCRALLVAEQLEIRGLRNRYERGGFGVPLVSVVDNPRQSPVDEFLPAEGVAGPVTAVLSFGWPPSTTETGFSEAREATLAFYDPREVEFLGMEGYAVPLAADFTSHFAYQASLSDHSRVAITGLLKPESHFEREGLFLTEPYDREQIPIVMVHGLRSSPLAWMELTNDIFGDQELRDRFQVWHYLYPTGMPFLYSGGLLRQTMGRVRSTLDPEGDDPAMESMIFVAHSMGGLLTRTLVTDSGSRVWDVAFLVPPGQASGSPEDLAWLEDMFFFDAQDWIARVVFIAVPHNGSASAQSLIGRFGSTMVDMPNDMSQRVQGLVAENRDRLTPEMEKVMEKGLPESIRTLRPDHPVLLGLAEIPVDPDIPFHTIAGDRGKPDAEVISDGWVTFESANLEGAASVRVVPSGHNAYTHPQAISEIKRILRLHLRSLGVEVAPEPDDEPIPDSMTSTE